MYCTITFVDEVGRIKVAVETAFIWLQENLSY